MVGSGMALLRGYVRLAKPELWRMGAARRWRGQIQAEFVERLLLVHLLLPPHPLELVLPLQPTLEEIGSPDLQCPARP